MSTQPPSTPKPPPLPLNRRHRGELERFETAVAAVEASKELRKEKPGQERWGEFLNLVGLCLALGSWGYSVISPRTKLLARLGPTLWKFLGHGSSGMSRFIAAPDWFCCGDTNRDGWVRVVRLACSSKAADRKS